MKDISNEMSEDLCCKIVLCNVKFSGDQSLEKVKVMLMRFFFFEEKN